MTGWCYNGRERGGHKENQSRLGEGWGGGHLPHIWRGVNWIKIKYNSIQAESFDYFSTSMHDSGKNNKKCSRKYQEAWL